MSNGSINWLITVILVPLVFGAYLYTFAVDSKADSTAQAVKVEAEQRALEVKRDLKEQIVRSDQQAQEIKVDLKEQIQQSEQRVQESLKELKALIQARP
jgi:predicted Holliday junction resolvase-like endonuclease